MYSWHFSSKHDESGIFFFVRCATKVLLRKEPKLLMSIVSGVVCFLVDNVYKMVAVVEDVDDIRCVMA